jgi:ribosome-associated toxin RatA of RatAB toxin-antitoxin module
MTSSVTNARTVTTTHTAFVAAPPRAVYRLIADASRWPYLFSSILHVERLAAAATEDRLRLWTVGNGAVRAWTSRRSLDCDGLRIRFRQETPWPPVASMAGEWVFVPLPGNATSVVLLHEFRAIDDDPNNTALIKQAVDRNSTAELAALRSVAELGDRLAALVHSFADSVVIEAPLQPVYEFLSRAQDWPGQLPHVSRVVLDEAVPNVQTLELDSPGLDGAHVTTRMVRVCFPYHGIVYKQTDPPETMSAHVGRWQLFPTADGVRVTAYNTVLIRPGRATDGLGQPSSAELTGDLVRQLLRKNCLAILLHARNAAGGWAQRHG